MVNQPTNFEAKLYALRKSKDGLIVSFVVHPNDTPNDLITAPIGEQYIVALAPYVESPSVLPVTQEGERKALSGGAEGVTPAQRAIKMAHVYDSKEPGLLREIYDTCNIKSCSEFKTDPVALHKFETWEYITGRSQVRP